MSTLNRNNYIQLVKWSVPEDASRGEIRIVDWKPNNWTRETIYWIVYDTKNYNSTISVRICVQRCKSEL